MGSPVSGKGGKGGGADVPDFNELLNQQASLNRINVNSPFGTVRFEPGEIQRIREPQPIFGGARRDGEFGSTVGFGQGKPNREGDIRGQFITGFTPPVVERGPQTANIELSPGQQAILDRREEAQSGIGDLALSLLGEPLNRESIEDAVFQRGKRLLDPVFDERERSLSTNLANRGLPLTSEAFRTATGDFNRGRDQAFLDLADRSVLSGGAEQSRSFNNLLGLLSGTQVQTPIIFPPSPVDVTGPAGIQAQLEIADQQRQADREAGFLSLIGTLGGAAIAGSSRAFKHKKRPVEQFLPRMKGLTVEAWDYLPGLGDSDTHIGPYAEDFHETFGVGNSLTINFLDGLGACMGSIKELITRTDHLEERINA